MKNLILRNIYAARIYSFLVCLLFIFPLASCQIQLIAKYDETTDKAVTALHRKTENFLTQFQENIHTPAWSYSNKKDFYREVRVDISAIKVRAGALAQNTHTIKQLEILSKQFNLLENLHMKNSLNPISIGNIRNSFEVAFTAILKLEMAKRRGGD